MIKGITALVGVLAYFLIAYSYILSVSSEIIQMTGNNDVQDKGADSSNGLPNRLVTRSSSQNEKLAQ